MTELERYEPVQTTVLRSTVDQRTDGWVDAIGPIGELAEQVANTEFVPKGLRGKPAAVIAAILYGRELEMPPMQALANIHVVDGRPGLAAEQMRAMVLAAGHEITYPKFTGSQVVAVGRRRQPDGTLGAPTEVEWNTAMVQWAGLAGKDNHKKYPRAMLTARATADLCRLIFPDVTRGLPALEELEDGEQSPESAKSGSTTQEEPKKKVSRRTPAGTPKEAPGAQAEPPVRPDSAPGAPPRPPLPSRGGLGVAPEQVATVEPDAAVATADVPAGVTPGEGDAETAVTPPAGTTTDEQRQCPHISNGQQCRYYAGHLERGYKHTFGGGLQDPVSLKHCELPQEHEPHAWNPKKDEWYSCSGAPLELMGSEGDGSPDDAAATGEYADEPPIANQNGDTMYGKQEIPDADVVPDRPEGIHPGQKRALEVAFTSLKLPDRAQRHHAASALLGRKVTTFKPITEDEGGLSSLDGSKLLSAMANVSTVEQLEALIQEAAEKWGESDGGS